MNVLLQRKQNRTQHTEQEKEKSKDYNTNTSVSILYLLHSIIVFETDMLTNPKITIVTLQLEFCTYYVLRSIIVFEIPTIRHYKK